MNSQSTFSLERSSLTSWLDRQKELYCCCSRQICRDHITHVKGRTGLSPHCAMLSFSFICHSFPAALFHSAFTRCNGTLKRLRETWSKDFQIFYYYRCCCTHTFNVNSKLHIYACFLNLALSMLFWPLAKHKYGNLHFQTASSSLTLQVQGRFLSCFLEKLS